MFLRRLPASPRILKKSSLTTPHPTWSRPSLSKNAPWSYSPASTWTAAASLHNARVAQQSGGQSAGTAVSLPSSTQYQDSYALYQKTSSRMKANYGSFSPTNQELKDSIASGKVDPVQHMKTVLQTPLGDADIEIIRASIAGEMKRIRSSPRKRRKSMFRPGFARFILLRLFETEINVWQQLIDADHDSMAELCYLAILEGLEDIVIGWLKVDIGEDETHTKTLFRNNLLRILVRAHLMNNDTHSADDALRCFFKVDGMVRAVKRLPRSQSKDNGLLKLSIWPACTILCGTLGAGKVDQTSPQLFDKFCDFFEGYSTKKRGEQYRLAREYNIAAMRLSHPASPDYNPALALLREVRTLMQHATAGEVQNMLPAKVDAQRDFWRRVWKLAVQKGQSVDAAFVDELSEKLYGSRCSNHTLKRGPVSGAMSDTQR